MNQKDRNSRFYNALKDDNSKVLSEEFGGVNKALVDYLVFTRGADRQGAEDAVSVAFMKLLEAIKLNKIEKKEALFKWLQTTCRAVYRDEQNKLLNKATGKEEFNEEIHVHPEEQFDRLNDPVRQRLLKVCIELLTEEMKSTLDHIIKFPERSLKETSRILRVSYITLRRRKSRITHLLHECVQEKLQHN